MSAVHVQPVPVAHGYTRSDVPWQIDEGRRGDVCGANGRRFSWRIFHYLSGGGMKMFGRTVLQEERSRRQTRFLVFASVLAVMWAVALAI